ncbi:MAG: preprotein translocase subunit SecA [Lachnospiraceae bacterium]|nr:preprotein translocase subunit SecA [Lachnospiraceae bacterium]
MGLIKKIFGTHSEREIKALRPLLNKILGYREEMMAKSDEELRAKTQEFKDRLAKGETLDDILCEAFAVAREATRRVLNQEHYEVQILGGIIIHQGRIAEMKTGEGKTQTCILPAYLNALEGKGVHVVTVNDYLANRDAHWMGRVHESLGLTVGCVLNSMTSEERRKAYACDITYVTNNELGFDYLRDNMCTYKEELVLRGLHYAIIDEVDSILIDEARTPLIISGQSGKSNKLYEVANYIATRLEKGTVTEVNKMDMLAGIRPEETGDFVIDEKEKAINLTERGTRKVEEFFKIDNLADPENLEIQHHINQALRANYMMFKDQDYVVSDDQILIVDSFTGRIMPGRRYNDGLHQAIEAKEHVKVNRESATLATITFQNFFNKFDKKAGMTGTAVTEEKEFRGIYMMDVVEVPTNRPVARIDHQDSVYKSKAGKLRAVVAEVMRAHEKGQPVLVGTITIEASEELSALLKKQGIKHNVLNAKYHEQEAQIIADAGQHGAVTIATNMAGRGTDIKLDEESRAAGGLYVIGTERHESRRIDNQLRGRSGRQGDPGESRFFLSLEDDLLRLFGAERVMNMFSKMIGEDDEIVHGMLTRAIERAQKRIESNNYGIRKNLLEYDEVMNEQREIIYAERMRVLNGESMREVVLNMVNDIIERAVDEHISDDVNYTEWNLEELSHSINSVIPVGMIALKEDAKDVDKKQLVHMLKEIAVKLYEAKEAKLFSEVAVGTDPVEQFREFERVCLLKAIDVNWMGHIDDMDQLKQGIGLQAYGQKNPVIEYKMAAYDMFEAMTQSIQQDTVRRIYYARVQQNIEREQVAKVTGTNKDDTIANAPKRRTDKKIYPNDPCPCGSGKKYKNCHALQGGFKG